MNIQDSITDFEYQRSGRFSTQDRTVIFAVVTELSLSDFNVKKVNSKKYPSYIGDIDDIVHIHPTMIVSRQAFEGMTGEPSKYPTYPFQFRLEGWVAVKGNQGRPVCPACKLELPMVLTCDFCGFNPEED